MADVRSNDQSASAEQTLAKSINDLADEELAKIFKYLPLELRLLVSKVCKRWYEVTRRPWLEIVSIDISPIDPAYFVAIIKQSPNLQNVLAKGNEFWYHCKLGELARIRLSSLKLYDCKPTLAETDGQRFELFSAMFFPAHLQLASLEELVIHGLNANIYIIDYQSCYGCSVVGAFPTTLKRLQISGGLNVLFEGRQGDWKPKRGCFIDGLGRLQNLTCLILCSLPSSVRTEVPSCEITLIETALFHTSAYTELTALKNLVELCIGWPTEFWEYWSRDVVVDIMKLCVGLPKLKVLFVHNIYASAEYIRAIVKHPALRILVITGCFSYWHEFQEEPVPARRLYPNGFGSDPLPFLHVFLGKEASRWLMFAEASSDALEVHTITQPLASFLEKEDVSPIFEGVWIAGQIKEGAKQGAKLFDAHSEFWTHGAACSDCEE